MKQFRFLLYLLCFTLCNNESSGQILVPGSYDIDYYKVLQLQNNDLVDPINFRPSIITQYRIDSSLTWDIWENRFPIFQEEKEGLNFFWNYPSMTISFDSKYPRGYNDGAIWSGKGLMTSLTGGVYGNIGILHFAFNPIYSYAQNNHFEIPSHNFNKSEYSYPFENDIDWVQRYGDQAYHNFNLGQSELRLIYKKTTIGISTENMVWGPAQFNPILMSNNAAGIPRIDLGSSEPIKTKIGNIEFRAFWGVIKESNFFEKFEEKHERYWTGFTFGYQPSFIPGLSLGINRTMYKDHTLFPMEAKDIFWAFRINPEDDPGSVNDFYDQMVSGTLRWTFIEVGFETYVELAKNDFNDGLLDHLLEPDHSRSYTIGFIKTLNLKSGNILKLNYEHTTLGKSRFSRSTPPIYVHYVAKQGYTHEGQIIGSDIGPGSNSDYVSVNWYSPSGMIGFVSSRIRFNDDYYESNYESSDFFDQQDVEYNLTISALKFINRFSIGGKLGISQRLNWNYESGNNVNNFHVSCSLSYR
ncbi:MAG: hypothetical protein JXR07_12605 [Reichenbachiella sp.]